MRSRAYARVVPLTVAFGSMTWTSMAPPPVASVIADAFMKEFAESVTSCATVIVGVFDAAWSACAPRNASTTPETVALASWPLPPRSPMFTILLVALAFIAACAGVVSFSALAVTESEPAVRVTPSPTYARTAPLTVALGIITETLATPRAALFARAVADIDCASAVIVTAPLPTSMLAGVTGAVVPIVVPTCASTVPLTIAVASAPWPPRPLIAVEIVVADAVYSSVSAETESEPA